MNRMLMSKPVLSRDIGLSLRLPAGLQPPGLDSDGANARILDPVSLTILPYPNQGFITWALLGHYLLL
jgi:hypothetical protein